MGRRAPGESVMTATTTEELVASLRTRLPHCSGDALVAAAHELADTLPSTDSRLVASCWRDDLRTFYTSGMVDQYALMKWIIETTRPVMPDANLTGRVAQYLVMTALRDNVVGDTSLGSEHVAAAPVAGAYLDALAVVVGGVPAAWALAHQESQTRASAEL